MTARGSIREGVKTLFPVSETLAVILGRPLVAGLLGLALGIALLFASRASFRLMTPDNPAGLALAGTLLFVRMGVAAGALVVFHRFVRGGFTAFAAALAVGFVASYWVELIRYAGLLKKRPRVAGQPR